MITNQLKISYLKKFKRKFKFSVRFKYKSSIPINYCKIIIGIFHLRAHRIIHLLGIQFYSFRFQKSDYFGFIDKKLLGVAFVTIYYVNRIFFGEFVHIFASFFFQKIITIFYGVVVQIKNFVAEYVINIKTYFNKQHIRLICFQKNLALVVANRNFFLTNDKLMRDGFPEIMRSASLGLNMQLFFAWLRPQRLAYD